MAPPSLSTKRDERVPEVRSASSRLTWAQGKRAELRKRPRSSLISPAFEIAAWGGTMLFEPWLGPWYPLVESSFAVLVWWDVFPPTSVAVAAVCGVR